MPSCYAAKNGALLFTFMYLFISIFNLFTTTQKHRVVKVLSHKDTHKYIGTLWKIVVASGASEAPAQSRRQRQEGVSKKRQQPSSIPPFGFSYSTEIGLKYGSRKGTLQTGPILSTGACTVFSLAHLILEC